MCWKTFNRVPVHSAVIVGHEPVARYAETAPDALAPSVVWWRIFAPAPFAAGPEDRPRTRVAPSTHCLATGLRLDPRQRAEHVLATLWRTSLRDPPPRGRYRLLDEYGRSHPDVLLRRHRYIFLRITSLIAERPLRFALPFPLA
jgi:hypothetical protein